MPRNDVIPEVVIASYRLCPKEKIGIRHYKELELAAPFNYTNPDFGPQGGSPALTGASFSHSNLSNGFTSVSYRGAAGANDNWYKGWTNFKEIN